MVQVHNKLLPLVVLPLFGLSCSQHSFHKIAIRHGSEIALQDRINASQEYIEEAKKQANEFTLGEKAVILESMVDAFRMPEPFESILQSQLKKDREKKLGSLSQLYSFMHIAAAKHAALDDETALEEVKRGLELCKKINNAFGENGYMPSRVVQTKNILSKEKMNKLEAKLIDEENLLYYVGDPHGNFYTETFQNLHAVNTYVKDPEVKALLKDHVTDLITYLLKHEFEVTNIDGSMATSGDLTGNKYGGLHFSGELAKLTILRISEEIVNDPKILEEINSYTDKIKAYPVAHAMERFGPIQAATEGTQSRNFDNYVILKEIGKDDHLINEAMDRVWDHYREAHQSYPTWKYLSMMGRENWDFNDRKDDALALVYLESFPITRRRTEILNSFLPDPDIEIRSQYVIGKKHFQPKVVEPLPIYRRGIENEWNEDAWRINGSVGYQGDVLMIPEDFLLAFYTALNLGSIPSEKLTLREDKIEQGKQYVRQELDSIINPSE